MLPLPRDGIREHLADEPDPRNQIVWPIARFSEGRERNGSYNSAANTKRDAQMRAETRPLDIFGLAHRFRREIVGRILDDKRLSGAKLADKPLKPRGKRTQGRSLDPFYGRRRDNDKRAVVPKFRKGAAIEPEKLPESGLRYLDFLLDPLGRDVRQSRGEIGEHSLECQKFFSRRSASRLGVGLRRSIEGNRAWHRPRVSGAVTANTVVTCGLFQRAALDVPVAANRKCGTKHISSGCRHKAPTF